MSLSLMRRTWDSLVGYQRPLPPRRPITNPTRSRGIVLWSVCLLELSIGQQVVFVALLPLHQLLLASGLLLWWSQSTTKALLGRPKTNGLGVGSLLLFLLETRQPDTLMTMVAKGSASILWTFQRQHQTASPGASRAWKRPSWSALAQKHLWCMTSGRPLHRLWLTLGSNPRRLWTIARDGETVQRAFTPMTLKVNSPDWKGMWESVMAAYPSNAKGLTTQRKRMPWMPEISMSIHSKRM